MVCLIAATSLLREPFALCRQHVAPRPAYDLGYQRYHLWGGESRARSDLEPDLNPDPAEMAGVKRDGSRPPAYGSETHDVTRQAPRQYPF